MNMNAEITHPPSDNYVFLLTDDTGMFQHAKYSVPDPTKGYTTDDNARALIMADLLYATTGDPKYLSLVYRYLSFLLSAQNGTWFNNFMDYNRNFSESKRSEDCYGRCIWSLGFTAAQTGLPCGIRQAADYLLRETVSGCRSLQYPRAKAYAILGLAKWEGAESMVNQTAFDLANAYEHHADGQWQWFEDRLTYCNSILPWSMMEAYSVSMQKRYLEIGLESLNFLALKTFRQGIFRPIGCNGWLEKDKKASEFDQQPVEACEMLLANLKAYKLTNQKIYRDHAKQCLDWYIGRNSTGVSLIDPDTGGCMDGITPNGPNQNEGAESLVSWMIASLVWDKEEFKTKEDGKNDLL